MPHSNTVSLQIPLTGLLALTLFASALAWAALSAEPGLLDTPVADPQEPQTTITQQELVLEVRDEQEQLEELPREQLVVKAESGERAAQVALGADFAKEAATLTFAPAAANEAFEDAARWYTRAASQGFPGAPSLDYAGVRFFPIRIQRER